MLICPISLNLLQFAISHCSPFCDLMPTWICRHLNLSDTYRSILAKSSRLESLSFLTLAESTQSFLACLSSLNCNRISRFFVIALYQSVPFLLYYFSSLSIFLLIAVYLICKNFSILSSFCRYFIGVLFLPSFMLWK